MTKIMGPAGTSLLLLLLATPGRADESHDPATRSSIQDVIKKQLDAFARDDAEAAEAYATPGIREKFPEPQQFIDMVKKNYAPLVRPKSMQFGETKDTPRGPLQKVTVVAPDGTVWTAIYSLQKVDGTWRISGCGLKKEEGQQSI